MSMTSDRTVLLTGATGFVGSKLARGLLDRGDTVLALIRPRAQERGGELASVTSRAEALYQALDLDTHARRRLIPVQGDLSSLHPQALASTLVQTLRLLGRPLRLDAVVHAAARLQMDHAGQTDQRRAEIRARNLSTNVDGLSNLLNALTVFGANKTRPSLRILRPSIIAGAGSKDAYMAFLTYLNQRMLGVGVLDVGRRLTSRLPPGVTIPLPGNPLGKLDIVDIQDVTQATLALLEQDLERRANPDSPVGSLLQLSTAYAHGEVQGTQLERSLPSIDQLRPRNSYEESKARAEWVLQSWAGSQAEIRYNHLCSRQAPTLQQVSHTTLAAFYWQPSQIQRIAFVTPGEEFRSAMSTLRAASPLVYAIADGLWKKLPMLVAYINRPSDVTFASQKTTEDLADQGLEYKPQVFEEAYVRALVSSLL